MQDPTMYLESEAIRPGACAEPRVADLELRRSGPSISIVIPARNEAASLSPLLREIASVMEGHTFEAIVVDDGSSDATAETVAEVGHGAPWLRLIRHRAAAGKSAAIRSGVMAARGGIIVTIDGDGQNDPRFLPALLEPILRDQFIALVAGERIARHDGALKQRASRLANGVRRRMLGDGTRDTACGFKVIRREVYLRLPYFDNNHRFLPALVLREGQGIAHVEVEDRPRRHGASKYGLLDRALVGLPDLLGVWWLRHRRREVPDAEERTLG